MVKIRPFKAYHYDPDRVDVSRAVFPPYELNNKEFRDIFINISDYNIIRVVLGGIGKNNGERYEYSARLFEAWIKKRYIKKDEKPSIYVYSQQFEINGKPMERTGFISLIELEAFGKNIFPHELTLYEALINRKVLLEKTRANFGLIFSLYSDPQKKIEAILEAAKKSGPVMDFFTAYEGVRHMLWAITDERTINAITELMKDKKLLIADGHHRYKIHLEYSRSHPDDEGAKYNSMLMVNASNKGLLVLPTHRLIKGVKDFDSEKILEKLKAKFDIETIEFNDCCGIEEMRKLLAKLAEKKHEHKFGLYVGGGKLHVLKIKSEKYMDAAGKSDEWKSFDMNILHSIILKEIVGVDTTDEREQCHVEYVKDIGQHVLDCLHKVKSGECQAAIFVNPVSTETIKVIAEKGEMVPPKSTCYYPKVYNGLVMYKFENGERNF